MRYDDPIPGLPYPLKSRRRGDRVEVFLQLTYAQQKLVMESALIAEQTRHAIASAEAVEAPTEVADLLVRLEHDAKALANPGGLPLELVSRQ